MYKFFDYYFIYFVLRFVSRIYQTWHDSKLLAQLYEHLKQYNFKFVLNANQSKNNKPTHTSHSNTNSSDTTTSTSSATSTTSTTSCNKISLSSIKDTKPDTNQSQNQVFPSQESLFNTGIGTIRVTRNAPPPSSSITTGTDNSYSHSHLSTVTKTLRMLCGCCNNAVRKLYVCYLIHLHLLIYELNIK